jgi:hypothetical protein
VSSSATSVLQSNSSSVIAGETADREHMLLTEAAKFTVLPLEEQRQLCSLYCS